MPIRGRERPRNGPEIGNPGSVSQRPEGVAARGARRAGGLRVRGSAGPSGSGSNWPGRPRRGGRGARPSGGWRRGGRAARGGPSWPSGPPSSWPWANIQRAISAWRSGGPGSRTSACWTSLRWRASSRSLAAGPLGSAALGRSPEAVLLPGRGGGGPRRRTGRPSPPGRAAAGPRRHPSPRQGGPGPCREGGGRVGAPGPQRGRGGGSRRTRSPRSSATRPAPRWPAASSGLRAR